MDITWLKVLQLFLSLSLLIVLHEGGHFVAARMFKTRVDKFYLFFDFLFPFANLLNFSLVKKKVGDTEYGLGWFPLGGYVKIAGMVDESMDKEQLKLPPQPWEYRAKPAWQRLIIIMGGIIVNFVFGVLLFIISLWIWGKDSLPTENIKYGYAFNETAEKIGLRDGDLITAIGGVPIKTHEELRSKLFSLKSGNKKLQVVRNGQTLELTIPDDLIEQAEKDLFGFVTLRFPTEVEKVMPNSEASKIGMKTGDKIIAIDDTPIQFHDELVSTLWKKQGKEVNIKIVSGKDTLLRKTTIPDSTKGESAGRLGFKPFPPSKFMTIIKIRYTFWQAIPAGFMFTISRLVEYADNLFSPKIFKHVGGFASMASIFPETPTFEDFINLTAILSIILAFMNFLPIPMLDGGYVVFILYEMITRRKPSEKFMEYTNMVGMIFLFGLLIYANFKDVLRFW